MQNKSFKDIMQLEINVTNKLLEYMHSKIDIMNILEEYDLDLTYIQDERNSLALNIWLGVDYVDEDGRNFTEKFLEEKSHTLSKTEIEILIEKAESFVSLFEIIAFENGSVLLKDILNDRDHRVLEPNIHNVIEPGEFLFTRIGNVLNNTIFMGDINYVPSIVKDLFLEELLIDYNMVIKKEKNLSMIQYLKEHSLNLYKIYNESLINIIDSDGDIHSHVFDELDEFELYLVNKYKDAPAKKHLSNLTNIFEYALADNDMTLYDIDKLDFQDFFSSAMEDGFINSHEEFNSYMATLKHYLQYLSLVDSQYKSSYYDLLKVSKDRFQYMNKLDASNSFNLDKVLASSVAFSLSDHIIDILLDFDKFMLYISDSNLKLTSAKKHLKRKDLFILKDLFDTNFYVKKKAPNQEDFPLINLFFYTCLNLGAIEIEDNGLVLTNKGYSLLRLDEEEKYVLLLQYLWSKDFIRDILVNSDLYFVDVLKDKFTMILADLKANKDYPINELLPNLHEPFYDYYSYLYDFGLIKTTYDSVTSIIVTSLGKKVFNHFNRKTSVIHDPKIIKLDDFKKSKDNVEG